MRITSVLYETSYIRALMSTDEYDEIKNIKTGDEIKIIADKYNVGFHIIRYAINLIDQLELISPILKSSKFINIDVQNADIEAFTILISFVKKDVQM